jgi:hypothetical protein
VAAAKLMKAADYDFVVRYVRRSANHAYDITASELLGLLQAGLGVMLVQHVAPPNWQPIAANGKGYAAIAVDHAQKVGYPLGATLWCDLEGVASREWPPMAPDVIGYCNAWCDRASSGGYIPGLYVGDSCGLTALQLYRELRFQEYWSAYNLNLDNFPAVRGVQMLQHPYPPADRRVAGIDFKYQEDVIRPDALGGSPMLCLPTLAA